MAYSLCDHQLAQRNFDFGAGRSAYMQVPYNQVRRVIYGFTSTVDVFTF